MSYQDQVLAYFRNNLEQAVRTFDVNRDGFVDKNELIQILQQACVPYWVAVQYTNQIFAELDKNRDCRLSISDVQQGVTTCVQQNSLTLVEYLKRLFREQPQQAFGYYNQNRDCYLSAGEITQVLVQAGVSCYEANNAVQALFCEFDRNRDGYITWNELVAC